MRTFRRLAVAAALTFVAPRLASAEPSEAAAAAPKPLPPVKALAGLKLQVLGDAYGQLQAEQKNADSGSLGFGVGAEGKYLSISVFYKKSSDSEVRDEESQFGRFLLSPSAAGSSFAGEARAYPWVTEDEVLKLGFRGFFEAATADWARGDVKRSAGALASGVGPAVRVQLSHRGSKNEVFVSSHAGFTSRSVRGDAGSSNEFLSATLGAIRKDYYGYDASVTLNVKQVYGSLSYVRLYGPSVDGFTGGQILLAIGIRGGVDLL